MGIIKRNNTPGRTLRLKKKLEYSKVELSKFFLHTPQYVPLLSSGHVFESCVSEVPLGSCSVVERLWDRMLWLPQYDCAFGS